MTRPSNCPAETDYVGETLRCEKSIGHPDPVHISTQPNWLIGWEILGSTIKYRWQRRRSRLREDTGLQDKFGKPIREGDILEEDYNSWYRKVRVVVLWAPEKGAWISSGDFESGASHESLNGAHFKDCELVGNLEEHPERFYPVPKVTA